MEDAAHGDELRMDDLPPSAFSSQTGTAAYGRLQFQLSAWVGRGGSGEWLEVCLVNKKRWQNGEEEGCFVTGVATQGHPGEPWYVTRYKLMYTVDFQNWFDYGRGEVLRGNNDGVNVVEHRLTAVKAVAVRFVVVQAEGRPALRVAVRGVACTTKDPSGPGEQLKIDLLRLVNADKYADVAVIVQSGREQRTILAHRCVLASRSSYFSDALEQCQRQQTNPKRLTQIVIENIVPPEVTSTPSEACKLSCEIMLAVLTYIYTSVPPPPRLLYAVGRVAHQLHLGTLCTLTENVLSARAKNPDTCVDAFLEAFNEGRTDVQKEALATMKTHWEHITLGWERFTKQQILIILSAVEGKPRDGS